MRSVCLVSSYSSVLVDVIVGVDEGTGDRLEVQQRARDASTRVALKRVCR
jgi:hypothetical protein